MAIKYNPKDIKVAVSMMSFNYYGKLSLLMRGSLKFASIFLTMLTSNLGIH
tara:strand:- start:6219 stop:6371 length:153 start_codon:yes stop_codon:yes gene_type:complete